MIQTQQVVKISIITVAIAAVFLLTNLRYVEQYFPTFGGAQLNNSEQESLIIAKQRQIIEDAEAAIIAAEKALADSGANEKSTDNTHVQTWEIASATNNLQPKVPLGNRAKIFTVVKVNPHPEQFPSEGNQIQIPLLDGKSIKVNVESSHVTENGDYIWSGHLDGYNDDYPIVMTYGSSSTFASITTPEGSYSMEATEGVGWLYKNPSVAELSTPGTTDEVNVNLNESPHP